MALPVSENRTGDTENTAENRFSDALEETSKTELEAKLEDLLSQVEGVGKVRVMLMTGESKDSQGFYSSGETKVTGVLVAAEGADNSVTVQNIQQGVMALFQIEAHKIKVMKMK